MAADADFVLDAAFFVRKTPARAQRIARIIKELKLPKAPEDDVVLSSAFRSSGSGPPLILRIDESRYERDPLNYYIQMHLHHGTHGEMVPRDAAWAFGELTALATGGKATGGKATGGKATGGKATGGKATGSKTMGGKALFFLEAQLEMEEKVPLPSAVIAPPLTVGGRTLAVVGVEYGAPLDREGVDGFRWTRQGKVLKLTVSYSKVLPVSLLPKLWDQERTVVEQYVREVFPG